MCCQPEHWPHPSLSTFSRAFCLLIEPTTVLKQRQSPALGKLLCWLANLFEELTKSIFSVGVQRSDKGSSSLLLAFLKGLIHPTPGEGLDWWDTLPHCLCWPPHSRCHVVNLIPSLDLESFTTCWWQPHPFDLHFLDYMLGVKALQLNI